MLFFLSPFCILWMVFLILYSLLVNFTICFFVLCLFCMCITNAVSTNIFFCRREGRGFPAGSSQQDWSPYPFLHLWDISDKIDLLFLFFLFLVELCPVWSFICMSFCCINTVEYVHLDKLMYPTDGSYSLKDFRVTIHDSCICGLWINQSDNHIHQIYG